ncbi:hypothetical protein BD779DRAFT_1673601 [Infundibulicybe gibba]|nr:hypothetical protein BD779DRAFT_1673601 [Infundibulicybe gibba]
MNGSAGSNYGYNNGIDAEISALHPPSNIRKMKSITSIFALIAMLMATVTVALPVQEIGEAQNKGDFFIPIPIFTRPAPPVVPSVSGSNNKNAQGGTANGSAMGQVFGNGEIIGSGGDASASNA